MYSATTYLAFDPALATDVAGVFDGEPFMAMKTASGFRSGHWIEPIDHRSMGFLVFDTEEQARAATAPEKWVAPGMRVIHVVVARIAASG